MRQAWGGLGNGNSFSNNGTNTIQVRGSNANGQIKYSQTWRNQPLPYELMGDLVVRAADEAANGPAEWTIDPDVTFLIHPDANITIGSLYGDALINAMGTATNPITFTRLNAGSDAWGSLIFDAWSTTASELNYVNLLYGGSQINQRNGIISKQHTGALFLDHATMQHGLNAAVYANHGNLVVNDSTVTLNRISFEFATNVQAIIRSSTIANNIEDGIVNVSSASNCIDAIGNYWGDSAGPADGSSAADGCGNGRSNAGLGNSVTDGVLYTPWLPGDAAFLQDRSTINPEPYWVIADGLDSSTVTVKLRDANGDPLVGKQVELQSTVGTIVQPSSVTDAGGRVTAVISSTTPGFGIITAHNVTDNVPISGIGGISFWQGDGDLGGLVDPSGTPYDYPDLIVTGKPFQQGYPIGFRLPMQNSNPNPVDVEVVYGASGLNIGARFTPVYTATSTINSGESWDAPGVWVPTISGHSCIQAAISTEDGILSTLSINDSNSFTRQQNTDLNPCDTAVKYVNILKPLPSKGPQALLGVGGHFVKLYWLTTKVSECIRSIGFQTQTALSGPRDYEVVVEPPVLTSPPIVDPTLTPAQLAALNDLAQTSADIYGLKWAREQTSLSLYFALIADNILYEKIQYEAYQDLDLRYAQKLHQYADNIDALLAATEGAGIEDGTFDPVDFDTMTTELETNGFEAETETFYAATGLSGAEISSLETQMSAGYADTDPEFSGFYDYLRELRDGTREIADELTAQYSGVNNPLMATAETHQFRPQVYTFDVGNPTDTADTVELVIRPVNVPASWTYKLEQTSFDLDPGETVETTFTLYPNQSTLANDLIQVSVEGYIDDELIGGILFEHKTPGAGQSYVFLPMIIR